MNVDTLAWLVAICSRHRLFIDASTALAAGMIGAISLQLGRKTLREERWISYFGISFLILAAQYAIPSIISLGLLFHFWSSVSTEPKHLEWSLRFCSAVNNVFFLAAGTVLWRPEWKLRFRYWFAVSVIAAASVVMDWSGWLTPWHRSLDGILSMFAAGSLGVGFFFNVSPRRRLWLMVVACSGALLYVVLSLAVAIAPAVAEGRLWSDLSRSVSGALGASGKTSPATLLQAYDSFLIAISLVLKILLALGAFTLIVRALVMLSPRVLAKILQGVSRGDLDYFGSEGLVRAIGVSLRADRAAISIRQPGFSERQVTRVEWPYRGTRDRIADLPPADDGGEGEALATGRTVAKPIWGGTVKWWSRWWAPRRSSVRSLIAAPVLHHGTVIGCLKVEWDGPHAYTDTGVRQMERLAEMVATSIESRRRLAALAYLGHRLQKLNVETVPTGYRNLVLILVKTIYETLSPLSVGLSMEVGFAPVWAVVGDQGTKFGFRNDMSPGGLEFELRRWGGSSSKLIDWQAVMFGATEIGSLAILWPEIDQAPLVRPLVRSDELHRQSLVPPIANAVLRSSEAAFFHLLNDLQTSLIGTRRREEWLAAVERAVLGAGLVWVIAELPDGEFLGNGPHGLVRETAVGVEANSPLWHQRVEVPIAGTHHLVRLLLPTSGGKLWLGVSNPDLGPELEATWPWRSFLERLAGAADAALSGLSAAVELEKMRKEVNQVHGLLQSTVDSGTFIHEMRNIARNFKFAAQSLGEAKRRGQLEASIDIEKDIVDMQRSAERLYGLADNVLKPSALDGRLIYPLADLVKEVGDLYEPILHRDQIVLQVEIPADLEVATPSYAVHMALVSLVSNSVDAIESGGTIRIVGQLSEGHVHCHVIDGGSGIQLENPKSVFELGTTTKKNSGGIGLYMIRKLLEGVEAEVVLTDPRKGQTTFTLRLRPAPRKD